MRKTTEAIFEEFWSSAEHQASNNGECSMVVDEIFPNLFCKNYLRISLLLFIVSHRGAEVTKKPKLRNLSAFA
jgi:hypothetical protein